MRRLAACGLALLVIALAAACGGGSGSGGGGSEQGAQSLDAVLAAIEGLDAEAREAALVELAAAEGGELLWYATMSERDIEQVIAAFTEAYGIEVGYYRGKGGEVFQRAAEETAAGAPGPDLVNLGSEFVRGLNEEGLLGAYEPLSVEDLPADAVLDRWFAISTSVVGLTWNTSLVPPGEVPRSWEELADPRWRGTVGIDPSDADWYYTLFRHWVDGGRTEDEAEALFEEIAANAVFVRGHTAQAQLLAAGDLSLGVNSVSIIDDLEGDGAPVAWTPAVEPLVVDYTGVAVLERAPRPASAVLLADWLLSDPGKQVLAEAGIRVPSELENLGYAYAKTDTEDLSANLEEWESRFERLIGLGTSIEAP